MLTNTEKFQTIVFSCNNSNIKFNIGGKEIAAAKSLYALTTMLSRLLEKQASSSSEDMLHIYRENGYYESIYHLKPKLLLDPMKFLQW